MKYRWKIFTCLLFVILLLGSHHTVYGESHLPPAVLSLENAQYCIIDSPQFSDLSSKLVVMDSDAYKWRPFVDFNMKELSHDKDLFIKFDLPVLSWAEPAIHIAAFLDGFEVYLSLHRIFQYGDVAGESGELTHGTDFRYYQSHIIPIDNTLEEHSLIFRVFNNAGFNFGEIYSIMIGSREDLIEIQLSERDFAFKKGIKELLLASLLIFIGLVSFFIFAIRWQHRDYPFFCFGFFAVCVGIKYLFTPNLLFLYNISPMIYGYMEYVSFLLVPVGLFAFVEQMFGPGWRMIIRRLWQLHLIIAVVSIFPIRINLISYFFVVIILLIVNCFICLWFIIKSSAYDNVKPKIPFLIFFVLFIILLFIELLVDFLGVFYLDAWTYDLFGWGILALVFSLGYVLVNNYTMTYQKMQTVSLELEKSRYEMLELKQKNLRSQFEALKNQINPHFLFNNFSTLVSIIEENREMAVSFVQELSNVYRYILQIKRKALIEVRGEVDFIKSYEFLLSKRFENKFSISINIDENHINDFIPPFSLQLLIENAIKHNVISSRKPLFINVYNKDDYLYVENNVQIKKALEGSTKVGLSNIKSRYQFFTKREVEVCSDQTSFIVKIPLLKHDRDFKNEHNNY